MKRFVAALLVILILTVGVAAETLYDGTPVPEEAQQMPINNLAWSYLVATDTWYSKTGHTLAIDGFFISDTSQNYIYRSFYFNEAPKQYYTYFMEFTIYHNLGGSYTSNPFTLLTPSYSGTWYQRKLPIAFYNQENVDLLRNNQANGLNPGSTTSGLCNGIGIYTEFYNSVNGYYSLVTSWQAPTLKVSLVFRLPIEKYPQYADVRGFAIGFQFNEADVNMSLTNLTSKMWYDVDGRIYDELVLEQISGIKSSVDSGFQQAHQDAEMLNGTLNQIDDNLDAMHNTLIGDPSNAVDTSTLGSDLDEYADVEAEINNAIMQPITLPDGSQIQTDPSTLLELKSWILSEYDVQNYDPGVGSLINRVFDSFLPAMGSVIFLSLSLGIIVAFLASRRFS